jgi:NAD(P)-dependent dehydrogenase (short-subunit alcohol dehydrogenase family)
MTWQWVRRAQRRASYTLDGKVVVITGGSRGLGLELGRQFAKRGAKLVLIARAQEELAHAREELATGGTEVFTYVADVSEADEARAAIASAAERFGRVDVLVNCAGQIEVGPIEAMTLDDLRQGLRGNFWGAANAIDAAVPVMRAQRAGRIVNISSVGGLVGVPHLAPYVTGKFALTGYSLTLRAELARHGIIVTTVCPGLMRTGSPRKATFKGDAPAEYAWFHLSAALPVLSMSSTSAAERIVEATIDGDARLVLTLQAKAAAVLEALWPDAATFAAGVASRLMPQGESPTPGVAGEDLPDRLPSAWTALDRAAASRNNERGASR